MQENRSITTVSQAVTAGLTVTGLRGQIIAKPVPVTIIPVENTDYEEVPLLKSLHRKLPHRRLPRPSPLQSLHVAISMM